MTKYFEEVQTIYVIYALYSTVLLSIHNFLHFLAFRDYIGLYFLCAYLCLVYFFSFFPAIISFVFN